MIARVERYLPDATSVYWAVYKGIHLCDSDEYSFAATETFWSPASSPRLPAGGLWPTRQACRNAATLDYDWQNKQWVLLGKYFNKLLSVPPWLRVLLKLLDLFPQEHLLMEVLIEVAIHLHFHPVQVVWGKNLILILTGWRLIFRSWHIGWPCMHIHGLEQDTDQQSYSQEISAPLFPLNSHDCL